MNCKLHFDCGIYFLVTQEYFFVTLVIMNINDIYLKYRVNKGLREHMIRVAAVAQLICDKSTVEFDSKNIVIACLLHDMGSLIKAKMDSMPELYEPEGVEYWTQVQTEMKEQYGADEHTATVAIVNEINPGEKACFYTFDAIGTENTARVHAADSLGAKIATYSDMRVGPFGIISIKERMDDLRARYISRNKPGFSADDINMRESMLQDIEKEIFSHSTILSEDVSDETTAQIQKDLFVWEI